MSDFKALSARESAEIILTAENPVILLHVRPDADTVGTAKALAEVFRALGKAPAYASSDDVPKRLDFIIKDLPRVENLENSTVISVDVASPKQGGEALAKAEKIALMIDHHKIGEMFADGYILGDASSAAEVLLDIIDELILMGKIALTKEIAEPLYAAICSDTGGFRFSSATAKTFRAAARLIETGIDHADISHRLFFSKSAEQIRAEGFIAGKIELFADGKIASATHTKADRDTLKVKAEDFDCAIDVVRSICGVQIALILREEDDGKFKASLRSVGANVAEIAKAFGGGGHIRAAGCSPEADNIDEAKDKLINELLKII